MRERGRKRGRPGGEEHPEGLGRRKAWGKGKPGEKESLGNETLAVY